MPSRVDRASSRRARRLLLAASVAARHAAADGVVPAARLALRRVPPAPKRAALRVLAPAGPALAAARAALLWDLGRREEALAVAEAAGGRAGPRGLRSLVALAVSVDETGLAARLLAQLDPADPAPGGIRERRLRELVDGELAALALDPGGDADRSRRRAPSTGSRRSTVLHVVTNSVPHANAGYTVRTHETVRAQRAAGIEAHVVTRLGFPVAQGHLRAADLDVVDGVPYHRLLPACLPGRSDAALARGVDAAGALVERLRPAVLHAASDRANAQVALALRERYGLPVVYEVRGFLEESWLSRSPSHRADSDRYRLSREAETRCMHAADLVVTLGETMRGEILARGVAPEKVLVVPNAVDGRFLGPRVDAGALRRELGIGPEEYVVGLLSTFYSYEGIDTLLRAAAELRRRGVALRVLLAGDGPERAALVRQVAELGLAGIVLMPGRVPFAAVPRYHALLDVFVVPRTAARVCQLVTPLKPIEAMAYGTPLVASDVKALAELVEHDVTGLLTSAEDPVSLADNLELLAYDRPRRHRIGAAAKATERARHTWSDNATRYLSAYGSLGAVVT